jgi:hypothetical protein
VHPHTVGADSHAGTADSLISFRFMPFVMLMVLIMTPASNLADTGASVSVLTNYCVSGLQNQASIKTIAFRG